MGNWESFPFSQRQTNAVCFRGWEIIMCWSVLTSRAVNSHCLHCSAGADANRVVWSWGGPIQLTQSLHCWRALSELTRAQPAPAKAKELALPVDLWSLCFAGITDKFRVLCPEFLTVVSVGYPGVDLLGWQAEGCSWPCNLLQIKAGLEAAFDMFQLHKTMSLQCPCPHGVSRCCPGGLPPGQK